MSWTCRDDRRVLFTFEGFYLKHDTLLIKNDPQNILALNPKIQSFASVVPSAKTKKIKKHWKRNDDKNCGVINCLPLSPLPSHTHTHKHWSYIYNWRGNQRRHADRRISAKTSTTSSTRRWANAALWGKRRAVWSAPTRPAKSLARLNWTSRASYRASPPRWVTRYNGLGLLRTSTLMDLTPGLNSYRISAIQQVRNICNMSTIRVVQGGGNQGKHFW